jgi:hypothetical protein
MDLTQIRTMLTFKGFDFIFTSAQIKAAKPTGRISLLLLIVTRQEGDSDCSGDLMVIGTMIGLPTTFSNAAITPLFAATRPGRKFFCQPVGPRLHDSDSF